MKTISPQKSLAGALALAMPMILGIPATQAMDVTTSGDICAPVNVGKANRNILNTRGIIHNSSSFESIAVSCPIISDNWAGFDAVSTLVQTINFASSPQEVKCVLREKDLNGNDVRTITQTNFVGAGGWDFASYPDIEITDPNNRWNVTCLLPPNGAVGHINTWNVNFQ